MDVSVILKNLRISTEEIQDLDNCDSPACHSCPLATVLKGIQDMLKSDASEQGVFILGSTEQLFLNADANWLFPDIPYTEIRTMYINLVKSLTCYAKVPVCKAESDSVPSSFYTDIPGRACSVSSVMQALLLRLGDTGASSAQLTRNRSLTNSLAPFMSVFAVTHLQDQPWTSDASKKNALSLLACISQTAGHKSLLDLLCGNTVDEPTGIMQAVLDMLKSELTKENWKRNQATKHIFSWILVQVKRPWLVHYLESILPPSLLISDDYLLENKILGVHCLHHIILNVPAADLRQFNRAHVLYHALFNHLYTSELPLLQVVLPCLLDLLAVLEKSPADISCPRRRNRYDEVLCHILTYMEMEDKIALRLLYATTLIPFIEKMGIVIVRHLKRLERVIIGYLEISDSPEEKTRLTILTVLEKTIQVAWPRIESRMAALGRSLLRLLCDVSRETQPPDVRKNLLDKTTRCLQMLDYCTHGKLKAILTEVDNTAANETVLECIKMVTEVPSCELVPNTLESC